MVTCMWGYTPVWITGVLVSLSTMVPESWGKMWTAWLFSKGVDFFALKFYLDRVIPHQRYLASENYRHWATQRWSPHSCVFTCFDTILECDGQTDGWRDRRICCSIYSACKAGFAACCKNCKMSTSLNTQKTANMQQYVDNSMKIYGNNWLTQLTHVTSVSATQW